MLSEYVLCPGRGTGLWAQLRLWPMCPQWRPQFGVSVGMVDRLVCVRTRRGQLAKETISGLERAWTPSAHSAHYPPSLVFTARGKAQGTAVFTLPSVTHTHTNVHTRSCIYALKHSFTAPQMSTDKCCLFFHLSTTLISITRTETNIHFDFFFEKRHLLSF